MDNNQYDNTQMMNNNQQPVQQKGNFGWAVLGFFFPVIGLILFLVWRNNRPGDSKYAGIGALVSAILEILIVVVAFIFYGAVWGSVQSSVVDETCKTYGETYKGVKKGSTWYCQDTVTGQIINLE